MSQFIASIQNHVFDSARDAIDAVSDFEASTVNDWEYDIRAVFLADKVIGHSVRLRLAQPAPDVEEGDKISAIYKEAVVFNLIPRDKAHEPRRVGKAPELAAPFGPEPSGPAPVAPVMEDRRVWEVAEKIGHATTFDDPEAAVKWVDLFCEPESTFYRKIAGRHPERKDYTVMKDASVDGYVIRVNTPIGYMYMRRATV